MSTAATSPLSGDQQLPKQNGVRSASKRKPSDPILPPLKVNGKRNSRSPNEDSVYENIESDGEGSAILRSKILKLKNSPNSGLPGMVWAKAKKLNTPSNSTRRTSRSRERREQLPPAGELPLTPASKEREESKQLQQAEEARNARIAAAGAAKHRRQEEEEEETRLTEVERAKREGQERLEVEEFKKEEARRQVVFAKAARLEKEKEWKLKEERKTEEKRKGEQIAKEKEEANRQEQEQAECLRKVDEEKQQAKKAAEEEDKNSKKKASSESVNQERNSSPAGPQGTPVSTRGPQSSTPFMPVPSAKKSAMKSSVFSSQAAASSSLAITKTSPSPSKSVGIEAQLTLPKGRRVSFNDQIESTETPSKTQTSKTSTPKLSAIKLSGKRESLVKVVPPEKQSCTPILPPSTIKRPSKERSATLNTASIVQTAIVAPRLGFIANPSFKKTSPQVVIKSMSPTTRITPSQKSKTPVESKTAKGMLTPMTSHSCSSW